MKALWRDILAAVWVGFLLPGLLLNAAVYLSEQKTEEQPEEFSAGGIICQPILLRQENGNTVPMDMDVYLTGVLLGEMPASFHEEALKAQSVAARTYTYKSAITGGKHGDGSVCTDPGCCQTYLTEKMYFEKGGTPESLERIRSAVTDTSGLVLCYDGEPIEAVYFSSSGGNTEAALEVWGAEYPYLQSVSSYGENTPSHHQMSLSYTPLAFQEALGVILPGAPENWFGQLTRTAGGGVATLEIGEETYSGVELRSLLGLQSTAFSVTVEDEIITVATKGYGHRVGLSQYGAEAMAVRGSTWQEILAHYYPGTVLMGIVDEDGALLYD